ncbi:MAG: S-methyl-5'-thioadenosine phosphorylase [Candidatus Aminicenantes bacterium]|nr:S-methyl-5'-thioadenosine phosphorylase [Candidatus Aminicenantes bacterium]
MEPEMRLGLHQVNLGILGGTGLYKIDGIKIIEEIFLETPFGKPSDAFIIGELEGEKIAFLSRHGRGHRILPHELNYRANIYGFKMLGVKRIISISAVGSLKEELKPKDIVVPDQFFDRTHRKSTFFGEGIAVHVSLDPPVCPDFAGFLYDVGKELNLSIHRGGTYICIEGPAFSTKAESKIYRQWDCDIIGMTGATEAKLCREAEICYATLSLVTDYDVWHESEEPVTAELIFENLGQNIKNAKKILKQAVRSIPDHPFQECRCQRSLANCIVTQADLIPSEIKYNLKYIIGKYQ